MVSETRLTTPLPTNPLPAELIVVTPPIVTYDAIPPQLLEAKKLETVASHVLSVMRTASLESIPERHKLYVPERLMELNDSVVEVIGADDAKQAAAAEIVLEAAATVNEATDIPPKEILGPLVFFITELP